MCREDTLGSKFCQNNRGCNGEQKAESLGLPPPGCFGSLGSLFLLPPRAFFPRCASSFFEEYLHEGTVRVHCMRPILHRAPYRGQRALTLTGRTARNAITQPYRLRRTASIFRPALREFTRVYPCAQYPELTHSRPQRAGVYAEQFRRSTRTVNLVLG